jgi:hypothetical protein
MTVTIRVPRRKRATDAERPSERKPRRQKAQARTANQNGSGRPRGTTERLLFFLFLALPLVTLIQSVFARTAAYVVADQAPRETILAGPGWSFVVPFRVTNQQDIEELIQCESGGQNISKPDSDGITSDGILQFHRGPADTMSRGTWEDFSKASGLGGSPRNPTDAIRMTDWAISHDLGYRWTCWQRQGLSRGF